MTALNLLHELRTRGVRVVAAGDRLQVDAPAGALTSDLRQALTSWKAEILTLLRGEEPAGDVIPLPRAGCCPTSSSSASAKSPASLLAAAARLSARELNSWLEGPDPARQEIARSELRRRADLLLDEVEGRRPPPNKSVHDMFDEARARLGSRALEEPSITAWLRIHAPEVAALWPSAPLEASWFDWRLRVGPEHTVHLDAALNALQPQTHGRADPVTDGQVPLNP